MDFAKRAYDHGYHLDPIVRSLLDTDFYKLLMLQFIWKKHFYTRAKFGLTNRTKTILLGKVIRIDDLKDQLDYVKNLRFTNGELIWLRGQTFYGQKRLFCEAFVDFLRTFKLPDYTVKEGADGQLSLEFEGLWHEVSMWEIYALSIVNELYYRTLMEPMKQAQLDIMYAKAKVKLYSKLERLNQLPDLKLADFGTRRRHSFLWQEYCVVTAAEVLGSKFTGTSNALLAMKHGLEAIGTNAHELPMVLAALAKNDAELKDAQYQVLREWQAVYNEALLVMLPDTFGTTQFLADLDPVLAMTWKGARPDSKEPKAAGEELLDFWHRVDAGSVQNKLIIFSDGLDVKLPGEAARGSDIGELYNQFNGRCKIAFGWGTNLTNDFSGCVPGEPERMKSMSLVCKVIEADGKATCKLSDNFAKASSRSAETIARYRAVFGSEGMDNIQVQV